MKQIRHTSDGATPAGTSTKFYENEKFVNIFVIQFNPSLLNAIFVLVTTQGSLEK
jgi:hypothetical protein